MTRAPPDAHCQQTMPPEEVGGKLRLWQGPPIILFIQCVKTKRRPVSWLCFTRTLAFPSHLHVAHAWADRSSHVESAHPLYLHPHYHSSQGTTIPCLDGAVSLSSFTHSPYHLVSAWRPSHLVTSQPPMASHLLQLEIFCHANCGLAF